MIIYLFSNLTEIFKIMDALNKRSGFQGITGVPDSRDVEKRFEEGDQKSKLAIDMFCYRWPDICSFSYLKSYRLRILTYISKNNLRCSFQAGQIHCFLRHCSFERKSWRLDFHRRYWRKFILQGTFNDERYVVWLIIICAMTMLTDVVFLYSIVAKANYRVIGIIRIHVQWRKQHCKWKKQWWSNFRSKQGTFFHRYPH